jgi:hypothetical protein
VPNHPTVSEPRTERNKSAELKHLTPIKERDFVQRSVVEKHRDAERKPARNIEVGEKLHEKSLPQLSPPLADKHMAENRPARKEGSPELERLMPELLRQLPPPTQAIQTADQPAKRSNLNEVRDKSASNLEPRIASPVHPIAPTSDGPRLVIGQLRVDILPAVQTQTRGAVQSGQRPAGVSQTTRRVQPVSKLRFGLGQM